MINATQALYAFWNWISECPDKVYIGGGFHGAKLRGRLADFCEENDLPMLEDGWMEEIKFPMRNNRKVPKDYKHEKKS